MKKALVVLLVLAGLAVGQTIRPIPDTQVRVVGHIPAEWWVHLSLEAGQSYAVPSDRHLVITLADAATGSALADGQPIGGALNAVHASFSNNNGTRVTVAPGTLLIAGGQLLLWGYLEPVQ